MCGDAPDIKWILENETKYAEAQKKFKDALKSCFDKANIYIKRFDVLKDMYAEDCKMDPEEIRFERGEVKYFCTISKDTFMSKIYVHFFLSDLNVHRKLLERFKQEIGLLENIPDRQHLGLFVLKQEPLKEIMLPVTLKLLNELSSTLPR